MKKIISLFKRNYDTDHLVRDEVVEGAEWVIAGEGIATRKWDGTACLIKNGILYKRYDAKHGKAPKPGFIPAQDPDPITGHWPGWLKVGEGPEDRWFNSVLPLDGQPDGTYELCGPKIGNNPEKLDKHVLIKHGDWTLVPEVDKLLRTFEALKNYFSLDSSDIEGIVWHHPDGRMVKIKKKDFGFKR